MENKILRLWKGLLLFLLIKVTVAQINSDLCKLPNISPGPPLPKFPKLYSANAQVNYLSLYRTVEISEDADSEKGYKAVTVMMNGETTKLIYGNKILLKVVSTSDGSQCSVGTRPKPNISDMLKVATSLQVFSLLKAVEDEIIIPQKYFYLKDENKGILVDQWLGCAYLQQDNIYVRMTYSFSRSNWKPSYQQERTSEEAVFDRFPVQVDIKAEGTFNQKEESFIHIVFDYSLFRPFPPSLDKFQPPSDVYCAGYRSNALYPAFPAFFSYTSETVLHRGTDVNVAEVTHRTVNYDYRLNLTRMDFEEMERINEDDESPIIIPRERTIIQDFTTGFEYRINPTVGNCSVSKIQHNYGAIEGAESAGAVISNPLQFFALENVSISYNGKYLERGLSVDVFSGRVTLGETERLFHWYFSNNRTSFVEGRSVAKAVPVKVISRPERRYGVEGEYDINFYNFKAEEPDDKIFDTSLCYSESQEKEFVLIFSGQHAQYIKSSKKSFEFLLINTLREIARVSPLRLRLLQGIYHDEEGRVELKLFNVLKIGDVLVKSDWEKSLEDAEKALQKAVEEERIRIKIPLPNLQVAYVKPRKDGFQPLLKKEDEEETATSQYSKSEMAGLGLTMVIVGFILGGIVVNILSQRRAAKIRLHEDRVEIAIEHDTLESKI